MVNRSNKSTITITNNEKLRIMGILSGKHILIGVTGGIAAYKSATLVRLCVKAGADVKVVMTPNAREFITPLTLSTLSGNPVEIDFFDQKSGDWHSHVEMGRWADLMIIAPLTASTLGKMVTGVADNLLVTTYLSAKCPVMVAPAMDLDMFAHPSTQRNLSMLREWGVTVLDPDEGELASHLVGKGRMAEPETIFDECLDFFKPQKDLEGARILITSGPTYEEIDPVRFIGNYSTGKMGKALAEEAARRGASVHFVSGPVASYPSGVGIEVEKVISANEMLRSCMRQKGKYDVAIFCAAVADFRPNERQSSKIKREKLGDLHLTLTKNPDIAATLGESKDPTKQLHIGFGLESVFDESEARRKQDSKHFDLLVVNSLEDDGAGFGFETNKVRLVDDEKVMELPLLSKSEVASKIMDWIIAWQKK